MKQISILGCGWLGFPLAKALVNNGYKLKGSTTSNEKINILNTFNIKPYKIILKETTVEGHLQSFLKDSELLIINIPPRLRKNPNANHVSEIKTLLPFVEKSTIQKVFFVSSTSVFKDGINFPEITNETSPNSELSNAKQLIEVEKIIKNNTSFKSTVIRCSGLFDEKRHPGYVLSGKKNISNPDAPINLVHKEDVISILTSLINFDPLPSHINLSYPHHPSRKSYYNQFSAANHLAKPLFSDLSLSMGKIINSKFVEQLLNYSWKYKP